LVLKHANRKRKYIEKENQRINAHVLLLTPQVAKLGNSTF